MTSWNWIGEDGTTVCQVARKNSYDKLSKFSLLVSMTCCRCTYASPSMHLLIQHGCTLSFMCFESTITFRPLRGCTACLYDMYLTWTNSVVLSEGVEYYWHSFQICLRVAHLYRYCSTTLLSTSTRCTPVDIEMLQWGCRLYSSLVQYQVRQYQ